MVQVLKMSDDREACWRQIFREEERMVNQTKHRLTLRATPRLPNALLTELPLLRGFVLPPPPTPIWITSNGHDKYLRMASVKREFQLHGPELAHTHILLNKQELISGVPLPRAQPVIHFTGSHCPVFDKPCRRGGLILPHCRVSNPGCASNGVPQDQREEDPSVTSPEDQKDARISDIYHDPALYRLECLINNAHCSSDGVPQDQREEDPSVTSPEDQRGARMSDIYHDPALSPARGAGDEVTILPQCPISNAGDSSNGVPQDQKEEDPSVTSPEGQGDAKTSNIYHDPALSLARVKNNVNGCAGGIIGCAISFLQSDHVDEMNLVKPPDTCDNLELSAVNGGKTFKIAKGASSNMSGQRIVAKDTSSNISGQRIKQVNVCASNKSHDAQRTQISTGRQGNVADHYAGRNTCTEINSGTEEMSKPVNSQVLGHRGTQSRSAASNKHLPENLTHGLPGIRHQDVFSTMVQEVPCIQTSECVEAASVGKTEIDPDGCIEANPIRSGSNLDGNGLRVGGEVLHSRQPADYAFVNPKQLNFDDVEESCLNGISTPDLKKGMQGRSSEKSYISLMHAEDILAEGITVNYHDNCNTSLEMSFLGDREVSVGGKELQSSLSGAPEEQLHKSGRTSNENAASSVKEISNAHKDGVANTLLESGKVQKSFLIDNPTGLQVAQESLVESQSNVNSAKPTELVTEESALDSLAVGNPTVSTDSDFTIVSELGSLESRMQRILQLRILVLLPRMR
ncbi:unnamed protein product [Prunus armeniaca]|uniref:Uncharacterized protein n=1 Tax=Prunus armeniaca TaxID=36596 RepID=A0A6J5URK7_PRUAR|nr:unnamed protein product [Prunus armeniaca]